MQRPLDFGGGNFLEYVTAEQVQSLLVEASPLLWQAIYSPWLDFQRDRATDARFRDLNVGESAWWLHTQIKRAAILLAEDSPELGLAPSPPTSQQFYLNLRGELVMVFKKLRRHFSRRLGYEVLLRSNYPTEGNCDFWDQRKRAGALDAPRVIVGYEPIREMTEVRVHVGYPKNTGRRFDWVYEMPDQVAAGTALHKRLLARDAEEQKRAKGFVVSPRRKESGAAGA